MGAFLGKIATLVLKGWFSATFIVCILSNSVALTFLKYTPWLSKAKKQEFSSKFTRFFFSRIFTLNPQFRITQVRGDVEWDDVFQDGKPSPFLMLNHTSQLDAFLFTSALPYEYVHRFRTLAKISLFKLPIFGSLMEMCGHFPVHFNSSKSGNFAVDKTKQAAVMDDVDAHISSGGGVSFYPEGQINRKDSNTLQDFRRGSFNLAKKHGMELFGFLHTGIDDAWPVEDIVGGHFSSIRYKLFRVPQPPEGESDIVAYVDHVRDVMQAELHLLAAHSSSERSSALRELDEAVDAAAHGDERVAAALREAVDFHDKME